MEINKSVPLSRQLLSKIIAIVIASVVLFGLISLWFNQEQISLKHQLQNKLPQLEAAYLHASKQAVLQNQIIEALTLRQGEAAQTIHQTISTQLKTLDPESYNVTFAPFFAFDSDIIARLSQKSMQNELVKQTSINQVDILLASIQTQLAREAINLNEVELIRLHHIQTLLTQISVSLKTLDLQMQDVAFEQLSRNVEQLFFLLPDMSLQSPLISADLFEQFNTLEALLITEQRLLGKWRGYLRLYQEYKTLLTQELIPQISRMTVVEANAGQATPNTIGEMLGSYGFSLTEAEIRYGLLGALSATIICFLGLLLSIYRTVTRHREQLINTVDQAITGGDDLSMKHASDEISHVIQKINQIQHPEHDELDYQAMKKSLSMQLERIKTISRTAHWAISEGKLVDTSVTYLANVLRVSELDAAHWRKTFSKTSCREILALARKVKAEGHFGKITLVTESGIDIVLSLCFDDGVWFGTVAQNTDNAILNQEISLLNQQKHDIKIQAFENAYKSGDRLINMLVQAMLHSQNIALTSGTSMQSAYRPLARMFEWIRQQQILAQLNLSKHRRNLQDVVLVDEIHCGLYNVLSEANLHQNKVLLQCDANLASDVKLDVRLFGRLIVAFCRLALKEQFKGTLQFSVSAIDQNAGQQLVKFQANVSTAKRVSKLPHHLQLLNDAALNAEHTGVESYFFSLFSILHGKNLAAEVNDSGYALSFELPIATSVKSLAKKPDFTLKPTNILVICSDKSKQKIIKKYLELPCTTVEGLAKPSLFAQQFGLESLNRRKLDLVVYVDRQQDSLSDVVAHIDTLPSGKRPKLLVLQNAYHITLAKQGLYSLSSAPLCRESLLAECSRLLGGDEASNLLVSKEQFEPFKYMPSQVELLLAVKSPQQHQSLWLILQWLGFNVKVVCHGKAMQKHWETGRYLVLFNEFEDSPFIPLGTGKSISRGVFSFSDEEVIELEEHEAAIGEHWHLGTVPSIVQVKTLMQLLSPWLKAATTPITSRQYQSRAPLSNQEQTKYTESLRNAKIFDSSIIEQLPPAFDLDSYASNQGSAELAVYMLEDYIESIADDIRLLETTLEKRSYKTLGSALSQLHMTANILSAKGLLQITQQMSHAYKNESYENIRRLIEQAKIELSAIKAYAEAI